MPALQYTLQGMLMISVIAGIGTISSLVLIEYTVLQALKKFQTHTHIIICVLTISNIVSIAVLAIYCYAILFDLLIKQLITLDFQSALILSYFGSGALFIIGMVMYAYGLIKVVHNHASKVFRIFIYCVQTMLFAIVLIMIWWRIAVYIISFSDKFYTRPLEGKIITNSPILLPDYGDK